MTNPIEHTDKPENSPDEFDAADLDARISNAQNVKSDVALDSREADKGEADTNMPDEHIPAAAIGEAGDADRAETGAEKTEVKVFHSGGPERGG